MFKIKLKYSLFLVLTFSGNGDLLCRNIASIKISVFEKDLNSQHSVFAEFVLNLVHFDMFWEAKLLLELVACDLRPFGAHFSIIRGFYEERISICNYLQSTDKEEDITGMDMDSFFEIQSNPSYFSPVTWCSLVPPTQPNPWANPTKVQVWDISGIKVSFLSFVLFVAICAPKSTSGKPFFNDNDIEDLNLQ